MNELLVSFIFLSRLTSAKSSLPAGGLDGLALLPMAVAVKPCWESGLELSPA